MITGTYGKNINLGLQYIKQQIRVKEVVNADSIKDYLHVSRAHAYRILAIAYESRLVVRVDKNSGDYSSRSFKREIMAVKRKLAK